MNPGENNPELNDRWDQAKCVLEEQTAAIRALDKRLGELRQLEEDVHTAARKLIRLDPPAYVMDLAQDVLADAMAALKPFKYRLVAMVAAWAPPRGRGGRQ